MILVLFYVWEDVRVWAQWNYSLNMYFNYLGPVSSFLCPQFPSGHPVGGGYSGWWLDGGQHSLFTEMASNFFLSAQIKHI